MAASIVSLVALAWAGMLDRAGEVAVSATVPPQGHAYLVPRIELGSGALPNWFYDMAGDSAEVRTVSSLWLREDGRRMGPPHAGPHDLEEIGGGFYSHWNNTLWFSTSDNSDPRRNGRRYTVGLAPSTGRLLLAPGLLLIALVGWRQSRGIATGLPEIRTVARWLARHRVAARSWLAQHRVAVRSWLARHRAAARWWLAQHRVGLVDAGIRLLAGAIVLLLALAWAGTLDRAGDIPVSAIGPPRGHAYVVPQIDLRSGALPHWFYNMDGDRSVSPKASSLWLREDGRRMHGRHAGQHDLEEVGGGFYSHWNDSLWFSTSDNSDPRANGRRYTVGVAPSVGWLLLAPGLLLIALVGWRQSRGIAAGLPEIRAMARWLAQQRLAARWWLAQQRVAVRRWLAQHRVGLVDAGIRLLAGAVVLLLALAWAGTLDRAGEIAVSAIGPLRGYAYLVPQIDLRSGALPNWFYNMDGDGVGSPTASSLLLREDGRRMDRPHAGQHDLVEVGGGFYSHWNGSLWFSTSDNSDPRGNGRRYTVSLAPSTERLLLAPGLLLIALVGWRQSRGLAAGLPEIRAMAAGLARMRDTVRRRRATRFAIRSGIFAPLVSLAVLLALWLATMSISAPPHGDGDRLFEFARFVRGAAHGLAFWNPFRNGGYPLFADPEHAWLLSLFVNPAGPSGYLEFNLVFLALLAALAVPAWLICRRLDFSPFWTIVLVATLGFNERLILVQQEGRLTFLITCLVLLTIVWVLLAERLRPRHYVLLVVCLAVMIEEVVQKAVLYCLVIYAGLLLRHGLPFKQPVRQILHATAAALAISLAGLGLSAVWTLPVLAWFSNSHTPISALTYSASIPDSVLDYARTVVPLAPADKELVSFTSLILLPAALLIGLARLAQPARRAVAIGAPVYLWGLIFICMSLPFAGPLIRTAYAAFPPISGLRWFSPFGFAGMAFLAVGAVGILQSCESRRLAEVGWSARVLIGGYFAICAAFALWHGLRHDEALAICVAAAVGSFAFYFLAAASGRVTIKAVEQMTIKSSVGLLTAVSTVATMAAGLHWARELPREQRPEAPTLQDTVRDDPDPYFRYVRVSSANLWPLEAHERGIRAFSLYFSHEFANSLLYLNPRHDLVELRPHWVRLADCDGLDPRALDLIGTKYVFCQRAALPAPAWQAVAQQHGQTLFRRSDYDGGIRLYCRWRAAGEEPAAIAREAVLDSFGQRVALVSAEDAAGMPAADADCPAGAGTIAKIDVVEDRPGRMVLNVTARNGGILVIPDNYSPGWRVSINGNEARALRVYDTYLGARIDRGENAITFEFRDNYFWIGLMISLTTLAGLMIYLAVSSVAGRRAALKVRGTTDPCPG